MLHIVPLIVLVVLFFTVLPGRQHSKGWGYCSGAIIGAIL